jgi:hypothetical protein
VPVPRLAIAVAIGASVAIALVAVARSGANDVDRSTYLRANQRLLDQVPKVPGASLSEVRVEPLRRRPEPFGRTHIYGYNTYATYDTTAKTTAAEISRFYSEALHRWRVNDWGWSTAWPKRLRGRTVPESRCFARGDAAVCISLSGFLVNGQIVSGSRFTIDVNYRAFETQPG